MVPIGVVMVVVVLPICGSDIGSGDGVDMGGATTAVVVVVQ